MSAFEAYIPMDRRHALLADQDLPDRSHGTAVFADISGFTPLTAALAQELGVRRGAEELTRQLNTVYGALIEEVHRYRGSVLNFNGDAITCWFDADDGLRAVTCAQAMQEAMTAFHQIFTPGGTAVSLAIKVGLASGPIRRFLIGNAEIQLIDALAGRTLKHMAGAEQQAEKGEIVIDEDTAANLGDGVTILTWRTDDDLGRRFGIVQAVKMRATPTPWPPIPADSLSDDLVRPWLLPPVYERLQSGQAGYLAELRPATPLFLRFSGIDYDGDDDAGEKLHQYISWVQSVLARYEGYILQLTIGDKGSYLYTAFGAPLAHVDDDARAVGAGLELSQPPDEFAFIDRVQIGISQGRMRAGAYGSDTRQTYGVLGEETNMAARLMGLAQSGQVLVRRWVAEAIARQYEMQGLGQMKVKGKAEPIQVYRVVERLTPTMQRPTSMFSRPLVGRMKELAQFQKWLDEAREHGRVIRLAGGTGVGKSHLAAEMTEMGRQADFQLAIGSCQSMSRGVAYAPWRLIIRALLNLEEPPGAGTRTDPLADRRQINRLQRIIRDLNPNWLLRLPLLGDLLDLPIPDNATTLALDPKLRQESLLALVTEMLQRWATEQPLLIMIDDVHWMDEASLALTRTLARAMGDVPLLLLLVHRPIQRRDETLLPELNELEHYHHLLVEELDGEAVAELVHQQLEGPVLPTAVSLIQNKAQGNPFFAEELIDNLLESGALQFLEDRQGWGLAPDTFNALREADCLVRQNGDWVVSEQAVLSAVDLGVPDSIYGTVLSRIDRLPEGHKLTLKVASVIGRLFAFNLVHEAHPVRPDPPILNSQATEMMNRDFIRLERPAQDGQGLTAVYLFKHNTTQEVTYDTLLFAQRQELHRAIGEAIEQFDNTAVVEIAYHAYRGEDWPRALSYQLKAGQNDQQLFANTEAIDHYRKALKSASHLPDEQTYAERLLAHSELGELLVTAGNYDQAREHLDAALALAQEMNDFEQQARICRWIGRMYELRGEYIPALEWLQNGLYILEDEELETAEAAELLLVAGLINTRQGNYDAALERCERSMALAQKLDEPAVLARAYNLLGHIRRIAGDSQAAIEHFRRALATYEAHDNIHGQGVSHNQIANAYFQQGQLQESDYHYQQARSIFNQLGDTYNQVLADNNLGGIALNRGRLDEAIAYYKNALRSMEQIGGSLWVLGALHMNLGGALVRDQRLDEADEHLQTSRTFFDQAQARDFLPELHRLFAEAALAADDLDTAVAHIEEALATGRELNMKGEEGNALRVLGQIHLRRNACVPAEEHLRASYDILSDLGDTYEAARTQLALAECLLCLEKREAARKVLDDCRAVFKQLDARLDWQLASDLHLRLLSDDA